MIHRKYDSRSIFVSKFHINAINFNEIEFSVNWPLTFCGRSLSRFAGPNDVDQCFCFNTLVNGVFVSVFVTSCFVAVM